MSDEIPPHSPLDEEFVDAEEEAEEEEATLIKKELFFDTVEGHQSSQENHHDAHEDDRTEDQVPDISGIEEGNLNLEHDPMTTSADEIEDLPAGDEEEVAAGGEEGDEVAKGDEVPDQLENSQAESGAEIPVDVFEEDAAPPPAQDPGSEEVAAEEAPVEEEITEVTEETVEETAPEVEEPVAEPEPEPEAEPEPEPEAPVEAEPEPETPVEAEPQPETPVEAEPEPEAPVEAEPEVPAEAEAESEPTQEAAEDANDKSFHLQDVPTPKRPRTPNDMDAPANEGAEETVEQSEKESSAPQSPAKSPSKTSQPATPSVVEPVENGVPSSPTKSSNVGSVPPTPKTPVSDAGAEAGSPASVRRSSQLSATTPKSPMANGAIQPGTPVVESASPAPTTPRSGVVTPGPRTPKSGAKAAKASEFDFEKEESPPQQPRTPKKTTFEDEVLQVKSPTKKRSKSPRSPKKKVRGGGGAAAVAAEGEPEAVSEDTAPISEESEMKDIPVEVSQEDPAAAAVEASDEVTEAPAEPEEAKDEAVEEPKEEVEEPKEEVSSPRRRVQSPSPPPSGRARPERDATKDYVPYDQDSHKEPVPPRMPTQHSFNSYAPPERASYQNISPWVNTANKYKNEHTSAIPFVPQSAYTSFFDDVVNTGAFSNSLYSTSRLLERSRSRTRERRSAMRSQRSASNYYRFASQYPAPLRTRDYSTPASAAISRAPSRAGSFISFLDYAGSKQYDLVRGGSRGSLYDSNQALSRSASRCNIDYYLGAGRMSRVDSYVNNLNSRYEWQVPSNYETYRSASRSHVTYPPVNQYETSFNYPSTYNDSAYQRQAAEENARSLRRFQGNVRNLFESRVDDLQRSLSRERYARDRLRSKYTQTAYQLEQACKQMDLLRCGSYSSLRSGSQPRTSIYTQFYPYY